MCARRRRRRRARRRRAARSCSRRAGPARAVAAGGRARPSRPRRVPALLAAPPPAAGGRRPPARDDERQPQRRADRARRRRRRDAGWARWSTALLTHDRAIHIRCDDSVVRAAPGRACRCCAVHAGTRPSRMPLPFPSPRTVARRRRRAEERRSRSRAGDDVVASHHIGDLEHLATYQSFLQAVDHLPALYGVRPEVVAHDLHPEYLSTKFALDLDLPIVGRAAPPRARRRVHGRARPHRSGARARVRRARLRRRRHALGRRAPGGRLRRLRARRPPRAASPCPAAWPRSASRGAWARSGRGVAGADPPARFADVDAATVHAVARPGRARARRR